MSMYAPANIKKYFEKDRVLFLKLYIFFHSLVLTFVLEQINI